MGGVLPFGHPNRLEPLCCPFIGFIRLRPLTDRNRGGSLLLDWPFYSILSPVSSSWRHRCRETQLRLKNGYNDDGLLATLRLAWNIAKHETRTLSIQKQVRYPALPFEYLADVTLIVHH